jgi:hypothetical protein
MTYSQLESKEVLFGGKTIEESLREVLIHQTFYGTEINPEYLESGE